MPPPSVVVVGLLIVVFAVIEQSADAVIVEETAPGEYNKWLDTIKLRDHLMRIYDSASVPVDKHGNGVNVTVYMWPYDILDVVIIVFALIATNIFYLFSNEAAGAIRISGWIDMVKFS